MLFWENCFYIDGMVLVDVLGIDNFEWNFVLGCFCLFLEDFF